MNCVFLLGEGHVLVVFLPEECLFLPGRVGGSWNSSPVPPRTKIVKEALFPAGC
jgi:hypothetical protein